MLKYLYLERSLIICHYGNDLGGREECECVRVCAFVFVYVCVCICLCVQVCIYM